MNAPLPEKKIDLFTSYFTARYETPCVGSDLTLGINEGSFHARQLRLGGLTYFAPEVCVANGDSYVEKNLRAPERHLRIISVLSFLSGAGIMLDIGSNIGLTSVPRAMMRQFTHIHAFEPEPKNFACLQASVEANGLGNRMTAWNLAVGAATSSGWIRLRSGMARHDMATLADNDTVACGVTSLDAWMEEQGVPPEDIRFVKVDVQGFEANVLHGASKILQLGKAVWQLEATPVLLERYGTPQEKFVALLKEHFSWFCDMENIRLGFRPILELQPGLGLTDRKFTDLILFRSPSLN